MTRSTHHRPAPSALTDSQLEVLRGMLYEQRAFRVEQLVALQDPARRGPFGSTDGDVGASLAVAARGALREVQKALWRIEEGRYGRCTGCGRRLEAERLEILPQVELCLPCQRAARA